MYRTIILLLCFMTLAAGCTKENQDASQDSVDRDAKMRREDKKDWSKPSNAKPVSRPGVQMFNRDVR